MALINDITIPLNNFQVVVQLSPLTTVRYSSLTTYILNQLQQLPVTMATKLKVRAVFNVKVMDPGVLLSRSVSELVRIVFLFWF